MVDFHTFPKVGFEDDDFTEISQFGGLCDRSLGGIYKLNA